MYEPFEDLLDQEFYGIYVVLWGKEDPDAKALIREILFYTNLSSEEYIASIKQFIVMKEWKDCFSIGFLNDKKVRDV